MFRKKFKKNVPPVVVLKKSLIAGVVCIATLIVCLIVHNLVQTSAPAEVAQQAHPPRVQKIADYRGSDWWKDQKIQKPARTSSPEPLKTLDPQSCAVDSGQTPTALSPEEQQAMAAPITSNQLLAESPASRETPLAAAAVSPDVVLEGEIPSEAEVIRDNAKGDRTALENPSTPYILQAGAVIPGVLLTAVNADLPNVILGQVRAPVYDSLTGRHLLIPQGAKLMGVYDAQVAYGQERLQVTWQHILFPNGQSRALNAMPGIDAVGSVGFKDQVENHYGSLFKGALLTSLFSLGGALSQPKTQEQSLNLASLGGLAAQSVAGTALATGHLLADKQIAVQPTLRIRPGYTFNIMVTHDLVFSGSYRE
jgi:type IV secretory pathway VirB10-like protein